MWTRQKKKSYRGRLIVPVLSVAFLTYFGFHAVHGDYGLNSKMHLERRAMELEADLAALTAERVALETRVGLMQRSKLERDMLDERARALLNVSRPDEIVIYR